jgi:hypothetical protein
MKALAIEILAGMVILLAIALGGYSFGVHTTDNAWLVKQAKAEREQNAKYQAEVARGDTAVAAYLQDHADQEDRYEKLNDQFKALRKRLPVAVPVRVAAAPAARDSPAAASPPGCGNASGERMELHAGDDPVPHLSLGAVWMWNSALAGHDVAAGACDAAAAADEAEAACAQDAGLDLDDAWTNQQENARSCALDRQRFRNLIEFVKGRQ